jgi:hypothetical protein
VVGVPVRVHSLDDEDLGIAHVPWPISDGDALELGHGPMLLLRVVDLVETGPHSPLVALVKVAPAPMLVRVEGAHAGAVSEGRLTLRGVREG